MKKNRLIMLIIVFACVCLQVVPAVAADFKASDQISTYAIDVTPNTSSLNIEFSVRGSGIMSKLGCESIDVYKKSGSYWVLSESLDENDSGMSKNNSSIYVNTISCNSNVGAEYKVVVTIFAENSAGRDARTKTVYVTGK